MVSSDAIYTLLIRTKEQKIWLEKKDSNITIGCLLPLLPPSIPNLRSITRRKLSEVMIKCNL